MEVAGVMEVVIRQIPRINNQSQNILLLGDSIISGVNTRGLLTGVHKNSKGGTTVQNLIDEVSLYDMKAFSAVTFLGGQ